MAYIHVRDDSFPGGSLGCGPGCPCGPCRSAAARLGQWYVRDEEATSESEARPSEGSAVQERGKEPRLGWTMGDTPPSRRLNMPPRRRIGMYIRTSGLSGKAITPQETGWSIGNLGQPARAENKFVSCGVPQQNAIQAAFVNAQKAVNNAAAVLGTAYGRGIMDARTRQLLNTHFHTTDRGDVLKIWRNVFRIGQALQKGLAFECMGYCSPLILRPVTCGYASATQWFGGRGNIRLCFDNRPPTACSFMNLAAPDQAALIIHEAAHRHVGIDDKAYVWENPTNSSRNYSALTSTQAMDNADSSLGFACSCRKGREPLIRPKLGDRDNMGSE
jgi:hypothetical protein